MIQAATTTTVSREATTGELLTKLREVMDDIDQASKLKSQLEQERSEIESLLLRRAESDGVDSYKNDLISVTVSERLRAKYAPEQWDDLVRWAASTGNTHIIQRRLTDAKIESLILDGVNIPGVTLEGFRKITVRRK